MAVHQTEPRIDADTIAVGATILAFSSGVISALTGTWLPVILTLTGIVWAGWYGNRQPSTPH